MTKNFMNASRPNPYAPHSRPDLVNSLAAHLLQYPQDIVDTKRLIKHFQVSAEEFQQALRKTHHEERMTISGDTPHDSRLRRDVVNQLAAHLLQYPQDIIDSKRLIKRFQVSTEEFQQALLSTNNDSHRA
jgi:ribosomal protein S15P/S13E